MRFPSLAMSPSSPPPLCDVAPVVSPVSLFAPPVTVLDGQRDGRSAAAPLVTPPLPAQLFACVTLPTSSGSSHRPSRLSGELDLTMLLSPSFAASSVSAAPGVASAVTISPTTRDTADPWHAPPANNVQIDPWHAPTTAKGVHVTVNTGDSMLNSMGTPPSNRPPAVAVTQSPAMIPSSSGATSSTPIVSPYPSFLATGGPLTYHLILKKHKQLPRCFPVEMRTTADLASLMLSSHAFNPLTLAPLVATPAASSAAASSAALLPTETLIVSVLDVIDVCEGVFDLTPDLLAKHIRKTVEGFHQERCFTLFLSHVEHSDKRAHSYAQNSHHHTAATAGHPIPFYFEAASIESMQSWVRSMHYLKEHTAATQPDDRRAQLVKLKRHSQMLRNLGGGAGSSNTLPGLDASPHLQHANTMPAAPVTATLSHSGSLNVLSTHQHPASAAPHPLVHSSSSSAFSFIPDAIKRAFHHASSVPTHHPSSSSSGVTPAASPYILLYDSLRSHKIPLQDGAGDAVEDQAAAAMLMPSPLAATSKTHSSSGSGSSVQAPMTPFSPATIPSPLHIDALASPVSPAPAPAAAGAAAAPILSPAARLAQKTDLLTSVLAHGQAFLHYHSRSLEHPPHIMYLWCSPDLNSIGWGPNRNATPLHSYPSSCISQMLTGVQCEIFGLAKFCFTLVLRVSKAQDHPKEHGRSHTAVSVQTPSSTMLSPPAFGSPSSNNSYAGGATPSSSSVHGRPTSPMPQEKSHHPRSHGMRGVFEAIRGRHGSWGGQPPTPTVDVSNASASHAATPSSAASPSVSSPRSHAHSHAHVPHVGATSLLSLHFATDTLSTLQLWLFALKWLRDAKSNVSTPFNVHRVAWMDTDLKWGGENLLATFGISPDRDKLVKIGGGGMANVYLITHQSTKQHFALKVFHHYPQVILHEIEIMKRVSHANCVQYYGCMPRGQELYVVLEYCDGGSVADMLRKSKEKMKEQHLSYILRKVLLALQYLHSLSILHRDVKSANILLTSTGQVKLTDFGISEHFVAKTPGTPHGSPPHTPSSLLHAATAAGAMNSPVSSSDSGGSPSTTAASVMAPQVSPSPPAAAPGAPARLAFGGSPLFMSPEALRGLELSPATDVYSLGITALEMAEGRPPHSECKTLFAVMQAVLQSPPPSVLTHARSYPNPSADFIDFVDRCLVHDPAQRWSVDQLLQHPFIVPHTAVVSTASATTTTTTTTPQGGVVSTARSFLLRSAAMITSSFGSAAGSSPAHHTSPMHTVSVSRVGTESSSSSPHSSVTNSPMMHAVNSKAANSVPSLALRTTADSNNSPAVTVTQHANPALLQVNWPTSGGSSKSSRSAHVSPSHSPHASQDGSGLAALVSGVGSGLASATGTTGSSTGLAALVSGGGCGLACTTGTIGSSPGLPALVSGVGSGLACTTTGSMGSSMGLAALVSSFGLACATGAMGSSTSVTCAAPKRTTLTSVGVSQNATLSLPSASPGAATAGAKSPHISPVLTSSGSSHNLQAVNPLSLDDVADEAFVSYLAHGTYARAQFHAHPHKHMGRRWSGTGTPATEPQHMQQRATSPMPPASGAHVSPAPQLLASDGHSLSAPQSQPPGRRRSLFGGRRSRASSPPASSHPASASPNPSAALLKKQSNERNLLMSPEAAAAPVATPSTTSFLAGKLQQMLSITKRTNVEKQPNADALLPPALFPTAKEREQLERDEEKKLSLKQQRTRDAAAAKSKPAASASAPRTSEGQQQHARQFSALPKLLPKLTLKRTASMSTVHAFELATQQPEADSDTLPPLNMPSPSRMLRNQTSPDAFSPVPRMHSAIAEGDEEAESALTSRHSRSASSLRKFSSARRSSTHGSELAEASSTRHSSGLLRQDSLLPPYEGPTPNDATTASAEASARNSPIVHDEEKDHPDAGDSATGSPLLQPEIQREYSYSHSVAPGSSKPKFLKSLKLTSKDTFDQTSTTNSPAISARNSNKSSASNGNMHTAGEMSALGSPADDASNDEPKRPSLKPMSSLSLEAEEADDDCPALPLYDKHDAEDADGDPFGSERRSLLKRQSSLTQGDNTDMNASYVISSHGTLIAGNFAISAQGLQAATGADGAISRRTSTIETVRNRARRASLTPAQSLSGTGSLTTRAASSPLYSRSPSDPVVSDDEESEDAGGAVDDPDSSPSGHREHSLSKEDLFTLGVIGKGQNGQVLKAIHLPSLTRVALKSVYAHDRSTRHQLLHELTAYLLFDSPFLVSFLGAYYEHDVIILATEFADHGSLQRFVQDHGPLKTRPRVFKQVAFQCVAGVKHMHDRHHLHRDIKPDNFLCDHEGRVKVSDFGLLKDLQTTQGVSSTFLGTMSYLSPERIVSGDYSYASDVWSLGLTFLFCLTGVAPPQNPDFFTMMDLITKHPPPKLTVEDGYEADLCDFVNGMLRMEEGDRYTCQQLLAHPFLLGDDALARDEFRLFSLFETRIPQTQRPGDPDCDVWRVGESNLPDLDLILEFIVKQHLLPELMPSNVRSRSATVVLPASSSPSVSMSSDSQGTTPLGRPLLSASDGAYTTSLHVNTRTDSLEFSSGDSSKLGSMTAADSTAHVEDAASLMDTVPLLQLPFGLSHSAAGVAAEESAAATREHSLTSAGASSFNSTSSDEPAQQATGPSVPLPATPSSTSTQQQLQQPQLHSPASSASAPSPISATGSTGSSSTLPPLPTFHAGSSSISSIASLPIHDEEDGPSQRSLPSEGPRLRSASSMSSVPALPDTPADSPKSSLHATLSDDGSASAEHNTDTDPDSALSQPAQPSPTSAADRPPFKTGGLSLHITAEESAEQQVSPNIQIASAVVDSLAVSVAAESNSPHPSPLSRTAMSLGAAIAAAADEDGADAGPIETFSPDTSSQMAGDFGIMASPSVGPVTASSSLVSSLSLSSPVPVDGQPIELLQLDADRCDCLSRTFGLTPDQVQAKFLIKQRELLRRIAATTTVS